MRMALIAFCEHALSPFHKFRFFARPFGLVRVLRGFFIRDILSLLSGMWDGWALDGNDALVRGQGFLGETSR